MQKGVRSGHSENVAVKDLVAQKDLVPLCWETWEGNMEEDVLELSLDSQLGFKQTETGSWHSRWQERPEQM